MNPDKKVFLSYSREDAAMAERLCKDIKKAGVSVWWDEECLLPGQDWKLEIRKALKECSHFIILLSEHSVSKRGFMQKEQRIALDIADEIPEGDIFIIPARLDDCEPAFEKYRKLHWVDLFPVYKKGLAKILKVLKPGREIPAAILNPYRGLEVFREEDAGLYFGREMFVRRLLQDIESKRFVAVIGPSGVGKSSSVYAGLFPELRKRKHENWRIASFRVGDRPFRSLAGALVAIAEPHLGITERSPKANRLSDEFDNGHATLRDMAGDFLAEHTESRILLFADQFEELYTACDGEKLRRRFLDELLAVLAVDRSPIGEKFRFILTLRADFMGKAISYGKFGDALQDADLLLRPMNAEELRLAVEKPAEIVGATFEPGLANRIIKDVKDEPGNLPLLEFALTELWDRQTNGHITHEAYDDMGRLENALARYADKIYNETLDSNVERRIAKRLFLDMTHLGEGVEDTRRRIRKSDVAQYPFDRHATDQVVQKLTDARLITSDEILVEDEKGTGTANSKVNKEAVLDVAHESLIRDWPLLREWLNENREAIRFERKLDAAAREWEQKGRLSGLLWRPPNFDLLKNYHQEKKENFNDLQLQFFQSSRNSLLMGKFIVWFFLLFIIIFIAIGFYFTNKERQIALKNEKKANYNLAKVLEEKAGIAIKDAKDGINTYNNYQKAWAFTLEVLNMDIGEKKLPVSLGRLSLFELRYGIYPYLWSSTDSAVYSRTKDRNRRFWDSDMEKETVMSEGNADSISTVCFSPDGRTIASGSTDNTVRLWDVDTGNEIALFKGDLGSVLTVCFSPDGKIIASGSGDNTVRLWDVASGKEVAIFEKDFNSISSVCFSPNGKTIVFGSWDTVRLWEVNTGKEIKIFKGHLGRVNSVRFSPDGKLVVSGSEDNTVSLWNVRTGKEIAIFNGHSDSVNSITFSPDGKIIASGSEDNTFRLWDVAIRKEIAVFYGHSNSVNSVCFSPNGKTIASGSSDNSVRLWDIKTKKEVILFKGHSDTVNSVCFNPDGKTIASGSWDNTVRLWNMETEKEISAIKGHLGPIESVCFSPDGKTIASGSWDNTIRLWNVETGKEVVVFHGHYSSVLSISYSPDGKTIVSNSGDNTVRLWDVKSGKEIAVFNGHSRACFSPNGKTLVASESRSIRIWNVDTGKEIQILVLENPVNDISFSPDGKTIALGSSDNTVRLWNVENGKETAVFKGHSDSAQCVCFSPEGKTIAYFGLNDNTIRILDVKTGKDIVLKGHSDRVNSVCFSPDGKIIASGSSDNSVRLWDVETGEKIAVLEGHTDNVSSVCFSPDGKTIASGSWDYMVRLWDVNTGKKTSVLKDPSRSIDSVSFSPDGKTIALEMITQTALCDAEIGKEIFVVEGNISDISFSPNGEIVVSGVRNNTVHLWDVKTGKEITVLNGHSDSVNSICFSPDGSTIASGSRDGTIRLWDVKTGKEIDLFNMNSGSVDNICFSPNGKTIASGAGAIRLWDVKTKKEIVVSEINGDYHVTVSMLCFSPNGKLIGYSLSNHEVYMLNLANNKVVRIYDGFYRVNDLCFSPDGETIALETGLESFEVSLWNVSTQKRIFSLEGDFDNVCFSPDGSTIASRYKEKEVAQWDVKTGKNISVSKGHSDIINSISFSSDGKFISSGSADSTIRIWEAQSGSEIAVLDEHRSFVFGASISPNNKNIVSFSANDTVRIWDLSLALDYYKNGKESPLFKKVCKFSADFIPYKVEGLNAVHNPIRYIPLKGKSTPYDAFQKPRPANKDIITWLLENSEE